MNGKPLYPHNILRNVAVENIRSDYFFAIDVVFITTPDAHGLLVDYLKPQNDYIISSFQRELHRKKMFVLPAFELFPEKGNLYATEGMLPDTKAEIVDMIQNQTLVPFRKGAEVGHMLTNFDKWLGLVGQEGQAFYYDVPLKGTKRRKVWEPYVIGYRPGIPCYWEDFRGYGYDKYSFFIECQLAGYSFAALHDLFCVHLDHSEVLKEEQVTLLQRNQVYYVKFKEYLRAEYASPAWLPFEESR